MINRIFDFFEQQAFGVCEWWANKLSLKLRSVRLSFIYLSFLTVGSPLIIYLIMAFVLEHKDFFKFKPRKRIWDL
jgi:phage shock protein C